MKGILKKSLVVGVGSTLLGGILFLVGCAGNGFNWNFLSTVQIQQMEYVESAEKNITDIHLSFDTTDFTICFDENAESISISYPQRQNKKGKNISKIQVVETETSIAITEKQTNYFYFFDFTDPLVTVTLPTSRVCALSITGSTGDIALNDGGVFSNLTVKVSTGDICLYNVQAEELQTTASTGDITINAANVTNNVSVQTSTGDISLQNTTTASLSAKASTGKINLTDAAVMNNVSVQTSTGDISLQNTTAVSLSAKASTGKINLTDAAVTDTLNVKTDTGDISLSESITANTLSITANTGDLKAKNALLDGKNISITTDTGNVSATLVGVKHDYAITVETDTGSKNISSNLENVLDGLISPTRTLKVKTDTGDIKIYFPVN